MWKNSYRHQINDLGHLFSQSSDSLFLLITILYQSGAKIAMPWAKSCRKKGKNYIKRTVPILPKMDFVGFCVGVGQIFTTFAAKFVMYII